jgi:hypothetical protein
MGWNWMVWKLATSGFLNLSSGQKEASVHRGFPTFQYIPASLDCDFPQHATPTTRLLLSPCHLFLYLPSSLVFLSLSLANMRATAGWTRSDLAIDFFSRSSSDNLALSADEAIDWLASFLDRSPILLIYLSKQTKRVFVKRRGSRLVRLRASPNDLNLSPEALPSQCGIVSRNETVFRWLH